MLKLKTGSNTRSDTLTRDPTRPGQNRPGGPWPVTRIPGSISAWWNPTVDKYGWKEFWNK